MIAWLRAWWAAWAYRNLKTVCLEDYGGEEWLTQEQADARVVAGNVRRIEPELPSPHTLLEEP